MAESGRRRRGICRALDLCHRDTFIFPTFGDVWCPCRGNGAVGLEPNAVSGFIGRCAGEEVINALVT